MERRKILLGSGAALATVLAGCSSTETGEETDDTSDSYDSDDTGTDDDYDDEDDDYEDVPGYDGEMESSSDVLSVTSLSHDGGHISAVIETETTDTEVLYAEIETLAEDIAYAISDRDRFKAEVETIELYLEHDGARVLGLFVDVQWVLDYLDDVISRDELVEKILDSKE
ncbi:hypothetical protein ACLI4Z_07950 [Natrialbaceae archaeon A-arb3/5]